MPSTGPLPYHEFVLRKPVTACSVLLLCLFAASSVPAWAATRPADRTRAAALPAPVPCPRCWHPDVNTSWQWQLSGPIDQSVDVQMYDVDLFDTSADDVTALQDAGRRVICYIDAGTWENWRPDAGEFPKKVLGRSNGWPGERWLDIRQLAILRPIMSARLDQCAQKGFNGVEFDNVDGYQNNTGFPITAQEQLKYDAWLANQAHLRELSAALKNDVDQVNQLLPYFDYSLDEQCFQYHECNKLEPFVAAGKPVFEVEYKLRTGQFCANANALDFNSLRKRLELDSWRRACR